MSKSKGSGNVADKRFTAGVTKLLRRFEGMVEGVAFQLVITYVIYFLYHPHGFDYSAYRWLELG